LGGKIFLQLSLEQQRGQKKKSDTKRSANDFYLLSGRMIFKSYAAGANSRQSDRVRRNRTICTVTSARTL